MSEAIVPCTCESHVFDFLLARAEEDELNTLRSVDPSQWNRLSASSQRWSKAVAFRDAVKVMADDAVACDEVERIGLVSAARILATIYAEHPDYDERWRP